MSSQASKIQIVRCKNKHVFFYPHDKCPICSNPLEGLSVDATATLVQQTVVYVNPSGAPFRLGLAMIECGARTLCRIDERVGNGTNELVRIERIDGIYHVLPQSE